MLVKEESGSIARTILIFIIKSNFNTKIHNCENICTDSKNRILKINRHELIDLSSLIIFSW